MKLCDGCIGPGITVQPFSLATLCGTQGPYLGFPSSSISSKLLSPSCLLRSKSNGLSSRHSKNCCLYPFERFPFRVTNDVAGMPSTITSNWYRRYFVRREGNAGESATSFHARSDDLSGKICSSVKFNGSPSSIFAARIDANKGVSPSSSFPEGNTKSDLTRPSGRVCATCTRWLLLFVSSGRRATSLTTLTHRKTRPLSTCKVASFDSTSANSSATLFALPCPH
mmetsp:Transcript_37608/g.93478  ORF Transcript_37608/g.93478 Transcript_37608/m.93478 type:complete len:225 (-) Transcript_37608:364-1038(-)